MLKKSKLSAELLEASKAQNSINVQLHKVRTSRINRSRVRRRDRRHQLASLPLDFLAIGDSWFEYPIYDNGPIPGETGIVAQTQLGSIGNPPPSILNQALHGQTTRSVLSLDNQENLISLLEDPGQWLNQNTGLPDAILVSAGGDDLVGDQFVIFLDYDGGGLNAVRFQGALDSVRASYLDLFAFRDIFAAGVPIVGHCYDYAIPNGVVPICIQNAWLQPSLDFAGYDYAQALAIVSQMVDQFHDMLAGLAADAPNQFTLIDTRNALTRDAARPLGWANEIHPYFAGFTALAEKFLLTLRNKFAGRI
jgi:hypothetical protein